MDFRVSKKLLAVVLMAGGIMLGLSSCSSCSSGDGEENSTYVNKEYLDTLNSTINTYTASTQEQRETLFRIMKELDEIADETFALGKERQLKGKVQDMRMVDKVKFKLATVQMELDQAREKAMENPELRATIDNLKRQIAEQEEYIDHLRSTIRVKKNKLQLRLAELEETKEQLEQSKKNYEDANMRLANEQQQLDEVVKNIWYKVGEKLEETADQVQLVMKKGNVVKETKEAKRNILKRAEEHYLKAADQGHPTATQSASRVKSKRENIN